MRFAAFRSGITLDGNSLISFNFGTISMELCVLAPRLQLICGIPNVARRPTMTAVAKPTRIANTTPANSDAEQLLRDAAFVLRLTRKVKAELLVSDRKSRESQPRDRTKRPPDWACSGRQTSGGRRLESGAIVGNHEKGGSGKV